MNTGHRALLSDRYSMLWQLYRYRTGAICSVHPISMSLETITNRMKEITMPRHLDKWIHSKFIHKMFFYDVTGTFRERVIRD